MNNKIYLTELWGALQKTITLRYLEHIGPGMSCRVTAMVIAIVAYQVYISLFHIFQYESVHIEEYLKNGAKYKISKSP